MRGETGLRALWGEEVLDAGFAIVPRRFLNAAATLELDAVDQALLVHVMALANGHRDPFCSYAVLADRLGINRRTVMRRLQDLSRRGLVRLGRSTKSDGSQGANTISLRPLVDALKKEQGPRGGDMESLPPSDKTDTGVVTKPTRGGVTGVTPVLPSTKAPNTRTNAANAHPAIDVKAMVDRYRGLPGVERSERDGPRIAGLVKQYGARTVEAALQACGQRIGQARKDPIGLLAVILREGRSFSPSIPGPEAFSQRFEEWERAAGRSAGTTAEFAAIRKKLGVTRLDGYRTAPPKDVLAVLPAGMARAGALLPSDPSAVRAWMSGDDHQPISGETHQDSSRVSRCPARKAAGG